MFNAYTFGFGRGLEPVLSKAYEGRVFRPQGWVSVVVLVDGCIESVWGYEVRNAQITVNVHMFSPPTDAVKDRIEAEVERLGAFLNNRVALEY